MPTLTDSLTDYVAKIGISRIYVNELEHQLDKLGWQYTDAQKREEYPQLLNQLINSVQERGNGYAKETYKYLALSTVGLAAGLSLIGFQEEAKEALGSLEEWITMGTALLISYALWRSTYAIALKSNMIRAKEILERRRESVPQ